MIQTICLDIFPLKSPSPSRISKVTNEKALRVDNTGFKLREQTNPQINPSPQRHYLIYWNFLRSNDDYLNASPNLVQSALYLHLALHS
jgi:hypothetical protein